MPEATAITLPYARAVNGQRIPFIYDENIGFFVGAKVVEHAPRARPRARVLVMVSQMDKEGFGACSNHGECAAVCPKGIGLSAIAGLNRAWLAAALKGPETES